MVASDLAYYSTSVVREQSHTVFILNFHGIWAKKEYVTSKYWSFLIALSHAHSLCKTPLVWIWFLCRNLIKHLMKTNWIASTDLSFPMCLCYSIINNLSQHLSCRIWNIKSGMLINTLSYQLWLDLYLVCCWSKGKVVSSFIDTVTTNYEDQGVLKTLSVVTKSLQSCPESYSTLADCT